MRPFTLSEAEAFLEAAFNIAPDSAGSGVVEAYIAGIDAEAARSDTESYLAFIPAQIDPDTITIADDKIDGADMDCAFITIRTAG